MELHLTEEQELFRTTVREFLEKECPLSRVRELVDDPDGFDRSWWCKAAELGWTSLLVDDDHGGGSLSDHGLSDLAILAEECGRLVAPGPIVPANVVAAALSDFGTGEQRDRWLDPLLVGESVAAWAWSTTPGASTVEVVGGRMTGTVRAVEAGPQADVFLVTARDGSDLTQFLVPSDADGVSVDAVRGLDAVRRHGTLRLDGVDVGPESVLGEAGGAAHALDRQWQTAVALQCAETAGVIDRVLEFTTAWAFDRYSFGRALASYQALKHRFADMKMWLEASHGITASVVSAVAQRDPRAAEILRSAAFYLGEHAPRLVQDCIQMHGGLGVTWEHDIHLYLRRVAANRAMYGTPEQALAELADLLEV